MQAINELGQRLETNFVNSGSILVPMGTFQASEPVAPKILIFQNLVGPRGLGN